jgi:hypothetical protein
MAKRYSKSETPSLGKNQEWHPTSGPSPYREHIAGGVAHPPERSVDAERATKWFDPARGAWSVRSKNAPAKGKRK